MDKENKSPSQALTYKETGKRKEGKNYKTSHELIQSNIVSSIFGHLSCMHFNRNL